MSTPLLEPFKDLAKWTTVAGTAPTISAGRTGLAANFATSGEITYRIPAIDESGTVIVGCAFKMSTNVGAGTPVMWLYSDLDATRHVGLRIDPNRAILVQRSSTLQIANSANGVVPLNTWCYLEARYVLGDSPNGAVTVKVNGTSVVTLTGSDTKNAGTKTTFDTVHLYGTTLVAFSFDDLYVACGAAEPFKGDTTIPEGVMVKAWNGSAFVNAPLKVWSGSAFADPVAVKTWNGSAFV